jgi:phage-related protein
MMNTAMFENERGQVLHPEELGLLLVSYDAPQPAPKTYYVDIDGADGNVDLSEWAGEIKFGMRTVTVEYRDIDGNGHARLMQFLHGRRVKITFSDMPDVYFTGRCTDAEESRRKRVTNQTYNFTCEPYALKHTPTVIHRDVTGSGVEIALQAARKSAIPTITVTAACTLVYGDNTYTIAAGTHTIPSLIVTDSAETLTVTGSGTITISWRDGVL